LGRSTVCRNERGCVGGGMLKENVGI
jgi:hypothetical protein